MPPYALTAQRAINKRLISAVILAAALLAQPLPAAAASWPSWLQVFDAATPEDAGGLATAATALATIPATTPAVAVHATPEGHWQFATRSGDLYTAGTPDELKRAASAILPASTDGFASAMLILSPDSLFSGADVLKNLPAANDTRVALTANALPLRRLADGTLAVAIRPNLVLPAIERALFTEALAQLTRPLEATRLRVLAATPGAAATLPSKPRFDTAEGAAAIDPVDPDRMADAIASIPRQIAVLTARNDGTTLTFAPAEGPERRIPLAPVEAAATAADVDLIIVTADPPRQPGGRNWLWQRIAVSGLDHARKRSTLADFLDALADGHGVFALTLAADNGGRVRLSASPIPASLTSTAGVTGWVRQATEAVAGHVTGSTAPAAIEARLVSSSRRRDLGQIFPGVPRPLPAFYLGALLLGLAALPVALKWWRRLWPAEARSEYDGVRGYRLARLLRMLAFVALFLPLAAIPAALATLAGWLKRASTSRATPDKAP